MADTLDDDFIASSPSLVGVGVGGVRSSDAGSISGSEAGDVVDLNASFVLDGDEDGDAEGGLITSRSKPSRGHERREEESSGGGKKRKRRDKEKERKAKKVAAHVEVSTSLASRPPYLQADYLRSCARKVKGFARMSEMELDEIAVKEASLVDTTRFGKQRELQTLSDFILQYFPSLKKELVETGGKAPGSVRNFGSPAVLVVTGNAQRAADLSRSLKALAGEITGVRPEAGKGGKRARKRTRVEEGEGEGEGDGEGDKMDEGEGGNGNGNGSSKGLTIGKLFGRHFKLAEHVSWLASHSCPLAVGTPQRLLDLVEKDAIKLDQLGVLLLDCTWLDSKSRNLLDGTETREATVRLLAHEKVGQRLRRAKVEGRARVVLF